MLILTTVSRGRSFRSSNDSIHAAANLGKALMVEALRDLRAEMDRQIETLKSDAAKRDAESIIKQREIDQLKARLAAIEAALSKLTNTK